MYMLIDKELFVNEAAVSLDIRTMFDGLILSFFIKMDDHPKRKMCKGDSKVDCGTLHCNSRTV